MNRDTIDFGIDLGTTNSSIALWGDQGQITVFKNLDESESTPSAVYEDAKHKLHVGMRAKNATERNDPDQVLLEFKQAMGRSTDFVFPRSGRKFKPEELSAEVLKALKADVRRRLDQDLDAAVITIPAAFDRSEISATHRAAELAGLIASPLCLEPVAAALAYAHKTPPDEGFWMVFDFGGGTFDAAVVQYKDEEFLVVNHRGDNYLGGKNIDWAILEQILIPAVQKEFGAPQFSRHSQDHSARNALGRLKFATERAKVRLSVEESTLVEVENLVPGEGFEPRPFEYELRRSEVNRAAEPYLLRAINLCREALEEKRLAPADLHRLILVGGPTQMPLFRQMLACGSSGLGIPLEHGLDPMTIVAQGAAIFARTQRRPARKQAVPLSTELVLELNYEPAGADAEPLMAGKLVLPAGDTPSGYTVEFFNPAWRSGSIPVSPEGAFITQLLAEQGENAYEIQVQDAQGTVRKTEPGRVTYLRKAMFKEIPLTHTIGVALANNQTDPVFDKGLPLPLRKMRDYQTTVAIGPDHPGAVIRIPLVEGSHPKADRNIPIGFLEVPSEKARRTVPAGSSIEFTLTVDVSNRLVAMAHIPVLQEDFGQIIELAKPSLDPDHLRQEAAAENKRLDQLRAKADQLRAPDPIRKLAALEQQNLPQEVAHAAALLGQDRDAADRLISRLRQLKAALDEVEAALEQPELLSKAQQNHSNVKQLLNISQCANGSDRDALDRLAREFDHAVQTGDSDLLRRNSAEMENLYFTIAHKDPGWWRAIFDELRRSRSQMTDPLLADDLFSQGNRSINHNDPDGLKSAVRQLIRLLPKEEAAKISGLGSTVI